LLAPRGLAFHPHASSSVCLCVCVCVSLSLCVSVCVCFSGSGLGDGTAVPCRQRAGHGPVAHRLCDGRQLAVQHVSADQPGEQRTVCVVHPCPSRLCPSHCRNRRAQRRGNDSSTSPQCLWCACQPALWWTVRKQSAPPSGIRAVWQPSASKHAIHPVWRQPAPPIAVWQPSACERANHPVWRQPAPPVAVWQPSACKPASHVVWRQSTPSAFWVCHHHCCSPSVRRVVRVSNHD
jgi:hypothetical protein